MRILKEAGCYNQETSVYVGRIHEKCSEQDLISEINRIFDFNRTYRKEIQKWEIIQKKRQGVAVDEEAITPYFVLSCSVFQTQTKRYALIDLSHPEAT